MANKFASRLIREANKTETENGAETYRSTTNPVLDFFYLAPARQGMDNIGLFVDAFNFNPNLAIKAAFYLRDIRGGKGQRQTFRDILSYLYAYEQEVFNLVVPFVPDFGRWDDILSFYDRGSVFQLVMNQLNLDIESDHPSLLGKWMPSANTSSDDTRALALEWVSRLGMTQTSYRKMLSSLRAKIGIVERKMSSNDWDEIFYPGVPGRAMKLYRNAFERHDGERFTDFTEKAVKGEVKINSSTVYPHELVYLALNDHDNSTYLNLKSKVKASTLDAMWNQLPNYVDLPKNILVVVDTSGSMFSNSAGKDTKIKAIHVSVALGLYCAERNTGAFKDMFITFSSKPQVQIVKGKNLVEKVLNLSTASWSMNTDLQATMNLILRMAVEDQIPVEDMPSNIVIISDMQFDQCAQGTNLNGIRRKYEQAGYPVPTVTFWNVQGRNVEAPALANDNGVYLVSGFSAETIGKVLNSESVTPEGLMLEVLNSPRYAFVDELI